MAASLARRVLGSESSAGAIDLVLGRPAAWNRPHRLGKSPSPAYEIFSQVISCESLGGEYLLRVLKERETGRLQLFLAHPVERLYQYVFVRVEGAARELLTDGHGRAWLDEGPDDLSKFRANIHPPAAVFEWSAGNRPSSAGSLRPAFESDPRAGWTLDVSVDENAGLAVIRAAASAASSSGDQALRMILIPDNVAPIISAAVGGRALFEAKAAARLYRLNVYE